MRRLVVQLRRLKDHSGLSLLSLQTKTGYSRASWERHLNGKALPPRQAVEGLARVGGVDPTRLLALHEVAEEAWRQEPHTSETAEPPQARDTQRTVSELLTGAGGSAAGERQSPARPVRISSGHMTGDAVLDDEDLLHKATTPSPRSRGRPAPLHPSDLDVLRYVLDCPGTGTSALARELGLHASNVSTTVRGLVTQGLIRREPDPHDRRAVQSTYDWLRAAEAKDESRSTTGDFWACLGALRTTPPN
ncbi:MarR family transcriptional regulator [Streptomyces sp. NPDC001020]